MFSEIVSIINSPNQHIIGHFGEESFQSITCTGTGNLTRTTKRQNTQITQNNTTRDPSEQRKTQSKTPESGIVALYDIRPWNGAGLFLQPRSDNVVWFVGQLRTEGLWMCTLGLQCSAEYWPGEQSGTSAAGHRQQQASRSAAEGKAGVRRHVWQARQNGPAEGESASVVRCLREITGRVILSYHRVVLTVWFSDRNGIRPIKNSGATICRGSLKGFTFVPIFFLLYVTFQLLSFLPSFFLSFQVHFTIDFGWIMLLLTRDLWIVLRELKCHVCWEIRKKWRVVQPGESD